MRKDTNQKKKTFTKVAQSTNLQTRETHHNPPPNHYPRIDPRPLAPTWQRDGFLNLAWIRNCCPKVDSMMTKSVLQRVLTDSLQLTAKVYTWKWDGVGIRISFPFGARPSFRGERLLVSGSVLCNDATSIHWKGEKMWSFGLKKWPKDLMITSRKIMKNHHFMIISTFKVLPALVAWVMQVPKIVLNCHPILGHSQEICEIHKGIKV